jgi:hypothetical protein
MNYRSFLFIFVMLACCLGSVACTESSAGGTGDSNSATGGDADTDADSDSDSDSDTDADTDADTDSDTDADTDTDTEADTDTDVDTGTDTGSDTEADTDADSDTDTDTKYESCDQWATWTIGNGYMIYNNIWGGGAGAQCLWAASQSHWGVNANHPNTGGIKSYPNADYDVDYNVGTMPTIKATFDSASPSWGSYNNAFDIWYNNYAYEIMIWVSWRGEMGPISYNWGCSGYPSTACPVKTNVSLSGYTWNLYNGTNGSAEVYSFLITSPISSGTIDITEISKWLASNGYFSTGTSTNLHEIQFGWEISQCSGGADFTMNSYSVDIGG